MISKKHHEAALENLKKANDTGRNILQREKNGRWKGGNRIKEYHLCPRCKKSMFREKRYRDKLCRECADVTRKFRGFKKEDATRSAFYWRAKKILIREGIEIPKGFHIHHKNGNWKDNRVENLEVISKYEHRRKYHNPRSKNFVC